MKTYSNNLQKKEKENMFNFPSKLLKRKIKEK